ncbi:MAG: hypothetical protein ACREIA_08655 [Opitutaceae bacterium]
MHRRQRRNQRAKIIITALGTYESVPGAPAWAIHQREAIERQRDIIYWLIDHRQQASGAYGGGWGDDCGMWRLWLPILIAFEDPKIIAAQERLSRGLLAQPHMRGGYTSKMSDAEHTAEDSADTITPLMMLDPTDPEWSGRARRIVDLARTQWTGINERGLLQLKSTYFTVDDIDLRPDRACASMYENRTLQPGLLAWQRTRDAELGAFFVPWLDGWHAVDRSEIRAGPAFLIASRERSRRLAVAGNSCPDAMPAANRPRLSRRWTSRSGSVHRSGSRVAIPVPE